MAIGQAALANHAALVAEGELRRSDVHAAMCIEADMLTDLIGTVPESDQAEIEALLDGYGTLMAELAD